MIRTITVLLATMAVAGCGSLRVSNPDEPPPAETALRVALQEKARPAFVTADREGARLWKLTREFYERTSHEFAWIDDRHPTAHMDDLIRALRTADAEGLDPAMYGLSALEARREEAAQGFLIKKGFDPILAGRLDVFLTYLYMKYASDLADGISDLVQADSTWRIEPEPFNPLDHLQRALAEKRVAESLSDLTPRAPQYTQLREALADYRRQAAAGGWPALPRNIRVKRGETSENVARLVRRLHASGDYTGNVPEDVETGSMSYDDSVVEAVQRFQRRHNLQDDGMAGPAVVAELNVPIERRIDQIRLNLERWRWLPRSLGERHILVNIPAYRLEVREEGKVALSMRTVVGRSDTPTPIFNDRMTYVVFSPYWNVPPNIAQNETLPAVMTDPAFLDRNDMEVVDASGRPVDPASVDLEDPTRYRFRQRPGVRNSLGLVKFMFPNQYSVYLHDTPADSLFARATRSFSHGCVRIEQPQALAEYLLEDQPEWTRERIIEAMHGAEERTVKLREPVPVYLGYWTAEAMPDGVHFAPDAYGIDRRQAALVAGRARRLEKTAGAALPGLDAPPKTPESGKEKTR